VATVPTSEPYGDIKEYAVKLFANNGKVSARREKNNGLLCLLALKERRVWVAVGYDHRAVEHRRLAAKQPRVMTPFFRNGQYGQGTARRRRADHRCAFARARGSPSRASVVQRRRRARAAAHPGWLPNRRFHVILIVSRLGGGGGRSGRDLGEGGRMVQEEWDSSEAEFGRRRFGGGGRGGGVGGWIQAVSGARQQWRAERRPPVGRNYMKMTRAR